MPRATFLVPLYEIPEPQWLHTCLDSIFAQEHRDDWECLIVSDGCPQEKLISDIEYYCDLNRRFRLVRRPHKGVVGALNFGLSLIDSEYVLRLDADDFNVGQRLSKQLNYMDNNPQISLCGGSMTDENGTREFIPYCPKRKPTHKGYREAIANNQSYCYHPSWCFRRAVLADGYVEGYEHAEDVATLCKLFVEGHKINNIPDTIIAHRLHPKRVSSIFGNIQKKNALQAITDILERNG